MNRFGGRLKKLRTDKKLSQRELAERFNISQSAIAYYESGKKEPNHEMLQKLADFFEVSLDYLLGRTDNTEPTQLETNQILEKISVLPPDVRKELTDAISAVINRQIKSNVLLQEWKKPEVKSFIKDNLNLTHVENAVNTLTDIKPMFLIADACLESNLYNEAVLQGLLAFEIFLGRVLQEALIISGTSEEDATEYLSRPGNIEIPTRVELLYPRLVKQDLRSYPYYQDFEKAQELRNKIAHTEYQASKDEAIAALSAFKKIAEFAVNDILKLKAQKESD